MKSWFLKTAFNFFPAFRATGARITYLSEEDREIHLRLPLNRNTKNYVGTIYGGAMYGAVDGLYMVMFVRALKPDYIVWDVSATIEYLKPGRGELTTQVIIRDEELAEIKNALKTEKSIRRDFPIEWKDAEGNVCCRVVKTLYFRKNPKAPALAA